ncbi:hypothetical protein BC826DRAFT_971512 [Russula brevipes]|nr:hypothetical protein BC826DRAFT_971512 [Russula brevipes]
MSRPIITCATGGETQGVVAPNRLEINALVKNRDHCSSPYTSKPSPRALRGRVCHSRLLFRHPELFTTSSTQLSIGLSYGQNFPRDRADFACLEEQDYFYAS